MFLKTSQSGLPTPPKPCESMWAYSGFSLILWPDVNGCLKHFHWKYMSTAAQSAAPRPNIA